MKGEFGASYRFFGESYEEFQKHRRQLKQSLNVGFNQSQARSITTIESAPGAISAWHDCMLKGGEQFLAYPRGEGGKNLLFTIQLEWQPAKGGASQVPISNFIVRSSPPSLPRIDDAVPEVLLTGTTGVPITRDRPDVQITIDVTIKNETFSQSESITIPAYVPPSPKLEPDPFYLTKDIASFDPNKFHYQKIVFNGRLMGREPISVGG